MASTSVKAPLLTLKDCFLLLALLLAALHWFALPKLTLTSITNPKGTQQEDLLLPANIQIKNGTTRAHVYSFTIDYKPTQHAIFHVHPQNCLKSITLNGFPLAFPLDRKCDFIEGTTLNLTGKLLEGSNVLRIETRAAGLAFGSVIFTGTSTLSDILGAMLVAMAAITIALAMQRLTGEPLTGIILAAGFILNAYVLSHTTFMWKKYDMPQHLEYITYIANNLRWPRTFDGFLTYHPPLYYSLQAVVMRITNLIGSFDVIGALRVFNLAYFTGALVFVVLALRMLVTQPVAYYMAVLMLVFYPGGIVTAGRMDSNLLFYTFFAGTLYFLLRWILLAGKRELAWALVLCGLAMATRTNALLLLPLFGLAALYYGWRNGWRILWEHRSSLVVWAGILAFTLGVLVNFGRPAYDNLLENRNQAYLVGNADYLASIAGSLRIKNKWNSYLTFNLNDYLDPPFFNVWGGYGGRFYFWVSVMKSSMYGEFEYPNRWIAYYLNCLLLGMVFYILASIAVGYRQLRHQPQWLILFFALFVPVMGLAANRMAHPIACSQDFRYFYPAIAAFCGMLGFAIQQHIIYRRWPLAIFGIAGMLAFTGLSVTFFIEMF